MKGSRTDTIIARRISSRSEERMFLKRHCSDTLQSKGAAESFRLPTRTNGRCTAKEESVEPTLTGHVVIG